MRPLAQPPASPAPPKHIVDALIEERAPTLFATAPGRLLMRHILFPALRYDEAVAAVDDVSPLGGREIMEEGVRRLRIDPGTIGLYRLPVRGRVIIAPNHPTGLADGVAVWEALRRIRPDLKILVNGDAIRLLPGLADLMIPVEWMKSRRNAADSRRLLADLATAFRDETAVVLFPAGRIAYMTWRGLRERAWMSTIVTLARKFDVPILPLHIRSRNSWLFYALSQVSTELRDVTLFHELLNKRGRRFELTFGDLIAPADLPGDTAEATRLLQHHVEDELPRASRRRPQIVAVRRRYTRARVPTA